MYKKCSFKILLVSMVVLLSSCTMMTERNSGEVAINISTSRNITDELKDATYTVTLFKSDGSIFDEKTTTSNEVKFTLIPRGDYIIKLVGETSRYILKGEASVTVNPGVENEAKLPVTYKMKTGNKFTATPIQRGIDLFIPSVDKAVTANILCYNTENQKKSFIDINAKNGYFGFVTDYFVQKDKVYNFTITYFDSNRKIVSSDTIENIKAIGGKGDFALEVKPVATYTESSSILKFTELPKIKNNDFETTYEVIYSKIKEGKEFAYSGFISNGEIDFSTVAFNDDSLYGKTVYNPELAATVKLEPNINQYVFFEKEDCAKIAQEITVNAPKNSVVEGKGIEINLKPYWDNNPTAETIMINRTRNSSNNRVDNEYITVRANITENEQGDIIQTIKEPTVTDYFVNNGDNYSYEIVVCDMDGNPLGASDKLGSYI